MRTQSFSSMATYEKCPAKYDFAYNKELPRGERSGAASRGSEIHESVDEFLQGSRNDLHSEINDAYLEFFTTLREMGAIPEEKWAVDDMWMPADFDDPNAMLRGIIDITLPLDDSKFALYELKTGKEYVDHVLQMNLFGTAKMVQTGQPDIEVHGVYFDQNKTKTVTYQNAMLNEYKALWNHKLAIIEEDTTWMKNPSYLCKWCDFSKHNGGPCQF